MSAALDLRPEPLTAAAFAPFGSVIEADPGAAIPINGGATFRHDARATLDPVHGGKPILSIFDGGPFPGAGPDRLTLHMLERHPDTAQAFMPLDAQPWAVVVAPRPEPGALRVFRARGDQGVLYHAGVWHHPLLVLTGRQRFLVVDRENMPGTLEEVFFDAPVSVALSAA